MQVKIKKKEKKSGWILMKVFIHVNDWDDVKVNVLANYV